MSLLSPTGIAVIGASAQEGKVGHDILKNLLTQGYKGNVYPVNPKGGEILGAHVYASIAELPADVDMAVIVIPAAAVAQAVRECGEKKIRNVTVISAGFTETHTDEGKKMEEEIAAIATQHDIKLIGPNCLGLLRPSVGLNASFAKDLPPAGSVAFISQSGATAVGLMDAARDHGIGFSSVLSIGNKAVLDECDFLTMLAEDEGTTVIGLYLESFKHGAQFARLAAQLSQKKHIVLLKSGVSQAGAKAASSHTGALAGSDSAVDALCTQSGIHRAKNSEEFFDLLAVLSTQPQLPTANIAVITNAGGPGILATDAAQLADLKLPALSEKHLIALKAKLPPAASCANPIDVLGDGGADRYEAAITACKADPSIDGLVIVLTPQVMTPCTDIAKTIVAQMKDSPLMPVTTCFMGDGAVHEALSVLRQAGIPSYDTPERAVRAMGALKIRDMRHKTLGFAQTLTSKVSRLTSAPPGLLSESATADLCTAYGLPLPGQSLAKTVNEALQAAAKITYPVVAKISSPQILHKTDSGGVRTHIKNETELGAAYAEILTNARKNAPSAQIQGVLIQKEMPAGDEFIVGIVQDPSFGPLIMVGLGGIYTELFHDVTFRLAPVDEEEAYRMLEELQSWKLLLGMRGKKQSDIDALAALIATASRMAVAEPRIKELDFNPVLVSSEEVVIVDAKVVIE